MAFDGIVNWLKKELGNQKTPISFGLPAGVTLEGQPTPPVSNHPVSLSMAGLTSLSPTQTSPTTFEYNGVGYANPQQTPMTHLNWNVLSDGSWGMANYQALPLAQPNYPTVQKLPYIGSQNGF